MIPQTPTPIRKRCSSVFSRKWENAVIDLSKAYKNSGNSAIGPRNAENIKDRTITKSNAFINF